MNILLVGGAGYVGSLLTPELLKKGHKVTVYDLFYYGDTINDHYNLTKIKGDIRDLQLLEESLHEIDVVIHLACISNDPSFDLDSRTSWSINYDSFEPFFKMCKEHKIKRFIYASSSSVYGVKEEPNVTEDLSLAPLTDYSKCKAACEEIILNNANDEMTCMIVRPATLCGYSPRLRLDLVVNIFATQALCREKITVLGGTQKRTHLNVQDMVNFYVACLSYPHDVVHKEIFNVTRENLTLDDLALKVKNAIGPHVEITHSPTKDFRSYQVSSEKAKKVLGFIPTYTIEDAVSSLENALNKGLIKDPENNPNYWNMKAMRLNSEEFNAFTPRS